MGYGIAFDLCSAFSLSDSGMGKNVIILEWISAHLRILIIRKKIF